MLVSYPAPYMGCGQACRRKVKVKVYDMRVANKFFLSRNVSITNKLKFFDAIVTPIACFGAGPHCIHSADMVRLDIHFRSMIRCAVGAPSAICRRDPFFFISKPRVGGIRGTNFCTFGINECEKWLRHLT